MSLVKFAYPELHEAQRAYLAGLFDGEGTICGYNQAQKWVTPKVGIKQKNREVLDWVRDLTGFGNVYFNGTAHEWTAQKRDNVIQFIEWIEPHCIVKSKQLLVGLHLALLVPTRTGSNFFNNEEDRESNRQARFALGRQLQELKRC